LYYINRIFTTMKIKRHNKKINKPVLAIAALVVVVLIGSLVYAFFINPRTENSTNTNQPKSTSSSEQESENLQNDTVDKNTAPNTDHPATPTATDSSNKRQVQMVASIDQSNNTVFIRGGVNYPVSGGACYAQLSGPSGQSRRENSAVLPNPASTDCKTIAIPVSDLAPGKWTFTLNYTSEEYEGASNEVSFTL
jgi:cytoskeletal protein RodZ